ncbi:MAG: 50S ribosomal protein L24 [Myxococcales bacterium]|nr:MAG: 50S ribosomal protein L24 [Myxococcales bacterium]
MNRLRVGDQVMVISGKDKGKSGRVARLFLDSDRVIVEGLNMVKRHTKPSPLNQNQGGILDKEMPLHTSNVMPIDPQSGKPTRVKIKDVDGKKVRVGKSGAALPTEEKLDGRRTADPAHEGALRVGRHAGAEEGLQLREPDAGSASREDRGEHGPGQGRG